MIRQGVASQDRGAVKNALQLAHQLGTPIEPPILEMLRKWLGEEAGEETSWRNSGSVEKDVHVDPSLQETCRHLLGCTQKGLKDTKER